MRAEDGYPNAVVLQQLTGALKALINGDVGLTEGVRQVAQWQFANHGLNDAEELFRAFVGVASETDVFPLGETRTLWAEDELARCDAEREQSEMLYRDWVLESATRLFTEATAVQMNSRFTKVPR